MSACAKSGLMQCSVKLIHAVSFIFVCQPHRLGHARVISQKSAATSS